MGSLKLYFTERGLAALEFAGKGALLAPEQDAPPPHLKPLIEAAKRELIAYFNGSHTDFASLTLDPGAPFQLQVGRNAAIPGPNHLLWRTGAEGMEKPSKEWVFCLRRTWPLALFTTGASRPGLPGKGRLPGRALPGTLSHSSKPSESSPTSGAPHRFCRPYPGPPGHPVSAPGVAGTAPDSLGADHLLRRTGPPGGQPQGLPGRGPGQRRQPHPLDHPLPPGHCGRRQPGGLQFGPGPQALAAAP